MENHIIFDLDDYYAIHFGLNMLISSDNKTYLTSKEAKTVLKVSDCHLAHMRVEGKLPFAKKGNAYMYEIMGLTKMLTK